MTPTYQRRERIHGLNFRDARYSDRSRRCHLTPRGRRARAVLFAVVTALTVWVCVTASVRDWHNQARYCAAHPQTTSLDCALTGGTK